MSFSFCIICRFVVQDTSLDAERLLSLIPLPSTCPISPSNSIRETLLSLFRALQHPYIHPILDVEFWEAGAALISPLNPSGSLKDLIYGENWFDDYERKYRTRGVGLDIRQVKNFQIFIFLLCLNLMKSIKLKYFRYNVLDVKYLRLCYF